jgi:cytochrome c oxidase subunit III
MSLDPRLYRSSPPPAARSRVSTAQFGMWLLLASLVMLFGATVIAYFVTRTTLQHWSGKDIGLPTGLIVSTGILLLVSTAFEWALRGIKKNRQRQLRQGLLLGGALAALFLLAQAANWFEILRMNPDLKDRELSIFTFYLLTGVHALHVIGGFVPLGWVLYRTTQREYSSSRFEGVKLCVQYWHFLGLIWLLLLLVMNLA